jgi:hypothetical protein
MTNKIAIALSLLTTTSLAVAEDSKDPPLSDPPKDIKIVEDKELLDTLYNTEYGKRMLDVLRSDEPIIDEMDPGAQCKDISAGKQFSWPAYDTDIAGFGVHLGLAGSIGITADSTQLKAEADFGPTLGVFGQTHKPIELDLSASTNNMGESSIDLRLLAFGHELDSYNIASTTDPLEYIDSVGWTLPDVISGNWGGSWDCDTFLTDSCSVSWNVTPLVANLAGIFVLRVNSHGVEAHALAAANAHSNASITGGFTGHYTDPTTNMRRDVSGTATGSGVFNFIRSLFWGSGVLAPYNSHWVAAAESDVNVEDVFGAKLSVHVDSDDLDFHNSHTFIDKEPMSFSDLWSYQCTFDKAFDTKVFK